MKKLLSLVLALAMCLGCCAMAQAAVETDYVGCWELESMTMFGVLTMSREELDYTVIVNIHEDETMLLEMDDTFAIAKVNYADGMAYMVAGEDAMPLTIDAEGKLNMTLTVEEISMDLKMARRAAPAADAAYVAYLGEWNLDHVSLFGLTMGPEDMGQIDLIAYSDGYGVISMEGELMSFKLVSDEGLVKMLDSEGMLYPLTINEQGQLSFDLTAEGLTMTIVMNAADGAAVEAPVTEPAAGKTAAPAASSDADERFNGKWVASSVKLMGFTFTMEEMEMSVSVDINGASAAMNFDGDEADCTVRMDGDTCILNDGETDAPCTLNENGQLCMQLEAEGIAMTLIMDRQ